MGMSKGRFLGLLIGLLLALGAAEFLGRLKTSSDRHLPRTPNLEVQLYPEQAELFGIRGETRHTTSSIGLRGPEPKTTDRLHILCVGGSTTACEYLDDQETWPQLLAAQFPETPTWVGNAGLSGHRAIDHVTLLSKLLDEQKPLDVVILLAGINDLAVAAEGRQDTEPKPTSSAQIRRVFHSQPRDFSLWPPGPNRYLCLVARLAQRTLGSRRPRRPCRRVLCPKTQGTLGAPAPNRDFAVP